MPIAPYLRPYRHRHGVSGRKPVPQPPPPVTLLHVLSVTRVGPAPNVSHWVFDRDIVVNLSPPVYPAGLTINGAGPVGMTLVAPRVLELAYPLVVTGGAWACPAEAANIRSVDGYKLAAGSGTVE